MLQWSTSHAKTRDISARLSCDVLAQLSCYMSAPLSIGLPVQWACDSNHNTIRHWCSQAEAKQVIVLVI